MGTAGKEVMVIDRQSVVVEKGVGKKEDYAKFMALDSVIFGSPSRGMFSASQRCGKAKL